MDITNNCRSDIKNYEFLDILTRLSENRVYE